MNIYQGLSRVFIPSASVSPHDHPGSQFEELQMKALRVWEAKSC